MSSDASTLESVLRGGKFAVSVEVGPSKDFDRSSFVSKAEALKGCADAFNVTDNQTAVVRFCSLAGSVVLLNLGLEPVLQLTCRDRNRIALQSDLLGARMLGVRNVLLLTGDHQSFGNHPAARGVFDLDSVQLIKAAYELSTQGVFMNGEPVKSGPMELFLGGAVNPFSGPLEMRVQRLAKKIDAGLEFVQTQSVYDVSRFGNFLDALQDAGLLNKVFVLAGVTPLKSVRMAQRMKFHVPGVVMPDKTFDRVCSSSDSSSAGFEVAVELLSELKGLRGLHGVHVTALFWEQIVPSLLRESGLLPK